MTVTDTAPVAGTHDPNLLLQVENVDKYRTVEPLRRDRVTRSGVSGP